jgi:predicted DCC family thiol-disulfide oxidoreductase YuxK
VQETDTRPRRIVLFDGVCVFCDGAVRWVMERDPQGLFHYATLQGELAAELRARHAEIPEDLETIVMVEQYPDEERVYRDSEAIFRVLSLLDSPWRHLALLRVLPERLKDFGYRLFARNRYRLFGRRDSCPIPKPEEAPRFLS